ncbi:unnamed protein product [Peniophora sp. CBMAI 1063]|nr:unnamed protein product [Peniophora sp. CBMAI 1063]
MPDVSARVWSYSLVFPYLTASTSLIPAEQMSYDGLDSITRGSFTPSSSSTEISALRRIRSITRLQDEQIAECTQRNPTPGKISERTATPHRSNQSLPGSSSDSPAHSPESNFAMHKALRKLHLAAWKPDHQHAERMWAIYLEHAEKVGPRARAWRADADGVLTFSALFSALVASFMIESYKAFTPDYNAASALMLSQLVIMFNETSSIAPSRIHPDQARVVYNSSLSAALGQASPRDYVTNALWISSLLVSVTSALCAVMIQQWTRRFENMCDGHFHKTGLSSEKTARVRLHVLGAAREDEFAKYIETIPRYLHASVFLFIVGLLFFFASFDTLIVCICIGFAILYLFDWYASMTLSVLRNPATLFQTPLTTGMWLFATKCQVASDTPRAFGDVFKQAFFWMFYIPNDLQRLCSDGDARTAPSPRKHCRLTLDDAVVQTLSENERLDMQLVAVELVSIFHRICVPAPDDLDVSYAFLAGLCQLVEDDHTVGDRILVNMHEGTPHHGSWESWLLAVLSACEIESPLPSQYAALCLRLHYHRLRRDRSLNTVHHTPAVSMPDPPVLATLQEFEYHSQRPVALAARCYRAWLAAGLAVDYGDAMTSASDVLWQYIGDIPNRVSEMTLESVGLATLAHPKHRCVAIALSLEDDFHASLGNVEETEALARCIRLLPDQGARAVDLYIGTGARVDDVSTLLDDLCARIPLANELRDALLALKPVDPQSPSKKAESEISTLAGLTRQGGFPMPKPLNPDSPDAIPSTSPSQLWRRFALRLFLFSRRGTSTSTSVEPADAEKRTSE